MEEKNSQTKKEKPEIKVPATVRRKQKFSAKINNSEERIQSSNYSQSFPTETNSQPIITDAQTFEPYRSNTQLEVSNLKETKPARRGRPRGSYKKKSSSKLEETFEFSQIENTQEEKSPSQSSQSQIFTSTQINDFSNIKKIENKKSSLNKNKTIQRDSKSNQQLCIRIRQNSELIHASKLPVDFWDNLINHRFWYEDLDYWD